MVLEYKTQKDVAVRSTRATRLTGCELSALVKSVTHFHVDNRKDHTFEEVEQLNLGLSAAVAAEEEDDENIIG